MLHATRDRLSVSHEWLNLTMLCAVTGIVGMLAVRELRVAPQAFASARASAPAAAASITIPPEAVSIATFVVGSQELRVGDLATEAVHLLAASATLAGTSDERGPLGLRQIRSYQLDGSNVIVVLESFERQGPMRVAAIYLH